MVSYHGYKILINPDKVRQSHFKILGCQLFLERRHYIKKLHVYLRHRKADPSLVKLTRAHDLLSRAHEIQTRAHDLVSLEHELVSRAHDIKYFTYMSL